VLQSLSKIDGALQLYMYTPRAWDVWAGVGVASPRRAITSCGSSWQRHCYRALSSSDTKAADLLWPSTLEGVKGQGHSGDATGEKDGTRLSRNSTILVTNMAADPSDTWLVVTGSEGRLIMLHGKVTGHNDYHTQEITLGNAVQHNTTVAKGVSIPCHLIWKFWTLTFLYGAVLRWHQSKRPSLAVNSEIKNCVTSKRYIWQVFHNVETHLNLKAFPFEITEKEIF